MKWLEKIASPLRFLVFVRSGSAALAESDHVRGASGNERDMVLWDSTVEKRPK
jgi:hypothetical protein